MDKELKEKVCEGIEKEIENIMNEGIQVDNIEMLGELVDIHKDLANEDYWCKKGESMNMRYRNYGEDYGRRGRDSRGRYNARGNARGYMGEEMLEELMENYGTYMGGGNYSGETEKAFDYMLKAAEDFMMHLMEESENPEQEEKIRKTARKISEMR